MRRNYDILYCIWLLLLLLCFLDFVSLWLLPGLAGCCLLLL